MESPFMRDLLKLATWFILGFFGFVAIALIISTIVEWLG
jgi:hypothetical protein